MTLEQVRGIIKNADNKESFLKRVGWHYTGHAYDAIVHAHDVAERTFVHVWRKSGDPYITHLRSVVLILVDYVRIHTRIDLSFQDWEVLSAALLHDIVEDIETWSCVRVEERFNANIAFIVDYVTRYAHAHLFHQRLRSVWYVEVILLKLADRLHNQLTLEYCSPRHIQRKMIETRDVYIPLAQKWGILDEELEATMQLHHIK